MRIVSKLAICLMLSGLSLTASAYDGWSTGVIDKIRIQGSRVLINQSGATNPGNCSNTDYLHLDQSDSPYAKNMFAAVLTAYASGKRVSFALTGCQTYPRITEVWVL